MLPTVRRWPLYTVQSVFQEQFSRQFPAALSGVAMDAQQANR